jgi:hypothetical protein
VESGACSPRRPYCGPQPLDRIVGRDSDVPDPVWKLQIEPGLRDALSAEVVATLAALRRGLPALAPGQGWQSEQTLHQRAPLRPQRGSMASFVVALDGTECSALMRISEGAVAIL